MKIIHTSDWHLGHQLHGFDRDHEHQQFLNWLSDLLITEQADVLLVSGDVFDTANPPASAWQMLYRFLADMSKALPDLDVIIAGGNHDSPSKLDAPHDLLKAFDLHMVGGIRRHSDGSLDTDRMLVPVSGKDGSKAIVMAVPFLRSADLRTQHLDEVDDRLIAGVADVYREMLEAAEKQRNAGEALIAMGHLYMASGQLSEMSERRVLGGNQHALPASIFDDRIDYVALGHLHLAQKVAGQERIRYCGSPIPLSISERDYKHQVLGVELADGKLASVTPHYVPRTVDIIRKPSKPQPLDVVLQELIAWQPGSLPRASQPLVEVPVLMDAPQPMLREKIHTALEGKPVRLARIAPHYTQQSQAENFAAKRLDDVSPEQVFQYGWEQKFDGAPPQEISDAFHALLTMVEEQEEGQA